MRDFKYIWVFGLTITILAVVVPIALVLSRPAEVTVDPWRRIEVRNNTVDHTSLMADSYETGSDVTRACLECHEDSAHQVTQTVHWTWQSEPVAVEGRDEPVAVGKANTLNNFCIGVQSNWAGCTRCHAGYGWQDAEFDFTQEEQVDCLVCHDQTGTYVKASAGLPAEGVDLTSVAQSVGVPTRENCGGCHFNGGGGNGVKHGDLDESLYFPPESVDVHMGRYDFLCIDCHQTTDHQISGRGISVSVDNANQIACTDCHDTNLHEDERISAHLDTVACQTCHIPSGATRDATKMYWDWSTAGNDDIEEDPHVYLKIKGTFVYESNFTPEYIWYNGTANRYLIGDELDPSGTTALNQPYGDINDPSALIWPFKIHVANQPYDIVYNYLLQPKTVGEGGYWTEFNWDLALRLGSEAAGLDYSGEFGFAETTMHWPITHMVVPSEQALQCTDCHGEGTRLDWIALGYSGDPMVWGGRTR
jgi:octaheme c-type cytochrome (tetrathionate reductase family)